MLQKSILKIFAAALALSGALVWVMLAQPSDLQTIVNNSLKAMGQQDAKTLVISGQGGDGAVGQTLNALSDHWRWYNDKNYVRSIDLDAKGWRIQRTRGEGENPPGGGAGTTTPAPDQNQNQVTMIGNNFNNQI